MTFIFKGIKKKFSSSQSTSSDSSLPVPLSVGKMLDSNTPIIQSSSAISAICLQVADFPQMLSAALGDIDIALEASNDWYCTHEREFDIVECVMSISNEVTREQLDFVSSRLEETLGIKTLAIFVHKEQGYFSNGKIHYDPHVHFICDFKNVKKYSLRYDLPTEVSLKEKVQSFALLYDKMSKDYLNIQNELKELKLAMPIEIEKARQSAYNKAKQQSYDEVSKELDDYRMKCKSLDVQLSQTVELLHTAENSSKKAKEKLTKLQNKSELELKKTLAENEAAWHTKLDNLINEALSNEKNENRKKIEKWENNNHELVKNLNDREVLISSLQEQITQLQNKLESTEKKCNDYYTNWSQVVDENSELINKLDKATQEIKEFSLLNSSSNERQQTPLYEELSSVKKDFTKAQKELSEIKKIRDAQREKIADLNKEIVDLQEKNNSNGNQSALLSEKEEQITQLIARQNELKHTISDQKILIRQLQGK